MLEVGERHGEKEGVFDLDKEMQRPREGGSFELRIEGVM